jgi:signal transduction histidine kinase
MGVPLRVLLVEDSEDDALLLLRELRRGDYDPVYERVDTAGAMEDALDERDWDLVIADHSMPAFSSSAALELLRNKGFADLPFIIVSGQIGEQVAVEAMKAGAQDYLMKGNLARLNTAIERELREAEGRRERIAERKQAERALREIREAERRRIARELHDVVLQDLTYAMQSLRVTRRMPAEARRDEETERQIEALERAVGGLRDAIYELRLESAQEQPLARTLFSIVELNRQMAPERALELVVEDGLPAALAGPESLEVARIVQEALANVRRHSGASRATVTLGAAGGEAWVAVEDDGRGFEPGKPAGMGLTGMRERALALGGELEVEGERGAGTRVLLRVPLPVLADEDPGYPNAPK